MYICRWSGGSVAFPVEGLEDSLRSPHPHSRERTASLLLDSLNLAEEYAARLRSDGHHPEVLRAGRQSDAKGWRNRTKRARHGTRINNAGELTTTDQAWEIPEGFVDTEADKHGTKVHVPFTALTPLRTNAEKAEWFKNYRPQNKTSLWQ